MAAPAASPIGNMAVDAADIGSPFVISDDGPGGFNQDVAADTGGYDLTHIGAVRGGAVSNNQFDGWTVATGADEGFVVALNDDLIGESTCPAGLGGATVLTLPRVGGRNVCEAFGLVSSDASMSSRIEWELEGRLQVGNDSNFARLTIESGTRSRGDLLEATDHLLVWPGSAIQANGTGARPIRFTSDDAGIVGSAEWGGLFLR